MEPCECVGVSAVKVFVLVRSTLANLDKADDDDESERQELCHGKEVLYSGGRPHTVAVHKRQHDCGERERTERDCETVFFLAMSSTT